MPRQAQYQPRQAQGSYTNQSYRRPIGASSPVGAAAAIPYGSSRGGVVYPPRRREVPADRRIGVRDVLRVTGTFIFGSKAKLEREPKIKYKTIAAQKDKANAFPITFVIASLILVAIIAYMVALYVQVNENEIGVFELKNEISVQQRMKAELEAQRDAREDIRFIEEQALSYGMVKKENLPKKYVSVLNEDKIEVFSNGQASENGDIISAVTDGINDIKEYMS